MGRRVVSRKPTIKSSGRPFALPPTRAPEQSSKAAAAKPADRSERDGFASGTQAASPWIVPPLKRTRPLTAGEPKVLASGFTFTEGPARGPDGRVYFTDQPNDAIWALTPGEGSGAKRIFSPSGRANGMAFDPQGNLLAAADEKNELVRFSASGEREVLVSGFDGKKLNGPNDVWPDLKGGIYFTDPYYERDYWKGRNGMEQDGQHVYYRAPDGKVARVADDLVKPNGIVGTPDGKYLYVADIEADKTYRYEVQPDGTLAKKALFANQGSDGMTLDSEGNVYMTLHDVTAYSPEGERVLRIAIPEQTSNVVFGGPDRKQLIVTASDKVYGVPMAVSGAA
jgi:gluconolactonase